MITQEKRNAFLNSAHSREPYSIVLNGIKLMVEHDVFPPDLGFTSQQLGHALRRYSSQNALDMGCGNGYLALLMRSYGFPRVTAVDRHEPAVQNTARNLLENHDLAPLRIIHSDLFSALSASEKFDLIVFNQPYYPSEEMTYGMGSDGGREIIVRFFNDARHFLDHHGQIVMPFSTFAGEENNPAHIALELGFDAQAIDTRVDDSSTHTIYEISAIS